MKYKQFYWLAHCWLCKEDDSSVEATSLMTTDSIFICWWVYSVVVWSTVDMWQYVCWCFIIHTVLLCNCGLQPAFEERYESCMCADAALCNLFHVVTVANSWLLRTKTWRRCTCWRTASQTPARPWCCGRWPAWTWSETSPSTPSLSTVPTGSSLFADCFVCSFSFFKLL